MTTINWSNHTTIFFPSNWGINKVKDWLRKNPQQEFPAIYRFPNYKRQIYCKILDPEPEQIVHKRHKLLSLTLLTHAMAYSFRKY
jgi:hypothetical protein